MTAWIVVTNGSAGKIISVTQNGKDITAVHEFAHPQTAKRVASDSDRENTPLSHAIDYDGDIEQHERQIFAKEITEFLTKAVALKKLSTLILVAQAKMLGEIRRETMHLLRQVHVYEVHKDLISQHLSDSDVVKRVKDELDLPNL